MRNLTTGHRSRSIALKRPPRSRPETWRSYSSALRNGSIVNRRPDPDAAGRFAARRSRVWTGHEADPRLLPLLPGFSGARVIAVNDRGEMVGIASDSGGGPFTVVVWRPKG